MNYKKNAEELRNMDLKKVGFYYCVEMSHLDERTRDYLMKEGYDDLTAWLSEYEIDSLKIHPDAVSWCESDCLMDEIDYVMESLIKKADHYLVMAYNCRWNGASGYKFADDIREALNRDYDTSIYPVTASRGGKVLVCREYSHDVPMGARTVIIALTDSQYEHLNAWYREWEEVKMFADRYAEAV